MLAVVDVIEIASELSSPASFGDFRRPNRRLRRLGFLSSSTLVTFAASLEKAGIAWASGDLFVDDRLPALVLAGFCGAKLASAASLCCGLRLPIAEASLSFRSAAITSEAATLLELPLLRLVRVRGRGELGTLALVDIGEGGRCPKAPSMTMLRSRFPLLDRIRYSCAAEIEEVDDSIDCALLARILLLEAERGRGDVCDVLRSLLPDALPVEDC